MAEFTIFHNPRCSKSRKALELLKSKTEDLEIIEYLDNGLSSKKLQEALNKGDFQAEEMVRPKEAKEEGVEFKGLADTKIIEAIAKNPRILQRPIVIKDKKSTIARDEDWFTRLN